MIHHGNFLLFLYIRLLCLLLPVLATGCSSDDSITVFRPIRLTGNQCSGFIGSRTASRTLLPADSRLSLFCSGGMTADNLPMTYNGTFWEGELPETWNDAEETADLAVYTPYINKESPEFYEENGLLKDILYDRQSCRKGDWISLTFKHLFARLTFHVSATINQELQSITFLPSVCVTDLDPYTGTLTMNTNGSPHPITLNKASDGIYSLIVPPSDQLEIGISIQTANGKTYNLLMPASSFTAGTAYSSHILYQPNKGIHTAADFIAFTHLINGEPYEGRTLNEFRTEENGRYVYRLTADIEFTPDECSQLMEIGIAYRSSLKQTLFEDIFDGQGHSISNFIHKTPEERSRFGLFGRIGENGVVKNLHIRNSSIHICEKTGVGFIAGINKGLISNCSVKNVSITETANAEEKEVGGIASNNLGYIVNCAVEAFNTEASATYIGGLIGINQGFLINSYAANCDLGSKSQAMLCYTCNPGYIYNCYCMDLKTKCYAFCNSTYQSSILQSCYYPEGITKFGNKSSNTETKEIGYFNEQSAVYLTKYLNNWISQKGESLFPGLELTGWQSSTYPPAALVP